jgi:plasmid stabilization system protein ParE
MMRSDFHPLAKQELKDAANYYDNISLVLGDAFLDEIERTLERIKTFPEAWTPLSLRTRRCRISGFPYGIIYQLQEQGILIVAIMHLQKQPNYWMDRVYE